MKRTLSALLTLALVVGLVLPVVAQAAATRQLSFGSLKSTYTLKPGKTISERAHIYSKTMDNNWRSHAAKIKFQKWNGSKWKTISTIKPSRWGWFNFKASSTGSYRLYYQGCKHFKTKIFKFKVNKPVVPPVVKPPVVPPIVPVVPDPPVVPPVVPVVPDPPVTPPIVKVDAAFTIDLKTISGSGIDTPNTDNSITAIADISSTTSAALLAGGKLELNYQGYDPSTSTWATIASKEVVGPYPLNNLSEDLTAADASSKRFSKLRIEAKWTGTAGTNAKTYYSNEKEIAWAVKVDPKLSVSAIIDGSGTSLSRKVTSTLPETMFTGASIDIKIQRTNDGTTWTDFTGFVQRNIEAAAGGGSEAVVYPDIEIGPGDRYVKQYRVVATWPGNEFTNPVALIEGAPVDNPYYVPMVDPGFSIVIDRITGAGISAVSPDNAISAFIDITHTAATSELSGGRLDLEYQGYNPSTSTWATIGSREMSGIYAMDDLDKDGLYAASAASVRFTKLRIKASWGGSTYTDAYEFYSDEVNIPWAHPE